MSDTMRALREVLGQKQFGNLLEMSAFLEREQQLYTEAIEKLAVSVVDAAIIAGQQPLKGTQSVLIRDGWLNDSVTVAAKMRTEMSARPEQFICFAAYMVDKYRSDADSAEAHRREADGRYRNLLELIAAARNIKELRASLPFRDDE